MIQMDVADKLERNWSGEKCDHNWEKELFLGTKAGDYRCKIFGTTCSEVDMHHNKEKQCICPQEESRRILCIVKNAKTNHTAIRAR